MALFHEKKTEILFLSDWLSKHVDGGGTCGKARIGADVPENFKSTLNDVVEGNICKHARMNNLMRSGNTPINSCYHPACCSGISKGHFLFMPFGLGQIREGGGWEAFSLLKSTQA